ncbi:MAG: glycosyltransferase family 2 protein [Candidatus Entotheonellia bacterium]
MVSVIVCTHNRAYRLEQTLKSLQEMIVPVGLPWEIIIVDNNSSDNTKEVIDNFINKFDLNVKYVVERHQGLSYARNMGVQEASGTIIAFTDDDCIVDRHWVTSISKEFHSDESIAGIGGRVELYNKMDRPVSIRVYGGKMILSSIDRLFNLIIGCNMAFARPVFDEIGVFDTDFGAGTRFASTEDIDFLYRTYKKGLKIIYSPEVLVYHNHGRRSDEQIKALYKGYAIGRGAFYCKHILMADKDVLYLAYSELSSLIKQITKRFIKGQLTANQRLFFIYIVIGFVYRLKR